MCFKAMQTHHSYTLIFSTVTLLESKEWDKIYISLISLYSLSKGRKALAVSHVVDHTIILKIHICYMFFLSKGAKLWSWLLYQSWQMYTSPAWRARRDMDRSSASYSVCNSELSCPVSRSACVWQCRTRRWCPASSPGQGWCTYLPSSSAGERDKGVWVGR